MWNVPLQHNLKSESLLYFSSLRCANVRTKHNNSNGGTPTTQKERWLDKTPQKKLPPNAPLHSWSRRQGTISARFKQYTDNPPTHEISFWSAFWQAPTNNACTQINVDKHRCQNLVFFHPCLEGWRLEREWSRVQRVCALKPSPGLGNHEVIMSVKRKATLIHNKVNRCREISINMDKYWAWSIDLVGQPPCHTSYLSFFLHWQNFWKIKFTPKNANFSR